jgi:hypothetical protein
MRFLTHRSRVAIDPMLWAYAEMQMMAMGKRPAKDHSVDDNDGL